MSQVGRVWYDAQSRFWNEQADWFSDSTEWVFLARVVRKVGRLLFPEHWNDADPASPWSPPIPSDPFTADEADIAYAQRLLLMHHEGYRDQALAHADLFLPIPTLHQWNFARHLSVEKAKLAEPSFDRFLTVARTLIGLFESGVIQTGARDIRGGAVTPIDPAYWNGESVGVRFRCCRIHPADPFTWQTVHEGGLLLFAKRQHLDAYCANGGRIASRLPLPTTEIFQIETARLSPYLRTVLQVALDLALDPDDPPKDSDLQGQLRAKWSPLDGELSPTMLRLMSKIMRSPRAQKGGAKPQRKTAQRR